MQPPANKEVPGLQKRGGERKLLRQAGIEMRPPAADLNCRLFRPVKSRSLVPFRQLVVRRDAAVISLATLAARR